MIRPARIAAAAAFAVAAALPIVSTTPAHASVQDCVDFLASQGFQGPEMERGCTQGSEGEHLGCAQILISNGVPANTAAEACSRSGGS